VHAFVNELERPIGTYLYGRRMYDVMRFWETVDTNGSPHVIADYAQIWRGATKIVYSKTLEAVSTQRTRLERDFVPEAIRDLKTHAGQDITIGGAGLAAQAIAAGLVDEYQVFLTPIVVGAGTHWLPRGVRVELDLQEERRFGSGVTFLRYRAKD
jgi:dihydrofolate reductase